MPQTKTRKHLPGITVDPNLPDLSKSAFAIKLAERGKALIAKYGLPKDEKPAKKRK